jgi:hypothetical protein
MKTRLLSPSRIKLLCACLAGAALGAAPASAVFNVLTNAGFETDAVLNAGPVPGASGWTSSGNTATASANGSPTHSGIGSLLLTGAGGFGVPLVSQTFPADPGQVWNLQGYLLTPATLPANSTFALFKMEWLDTNGVALAPGTAIIGTANNGANPGVESTPLLNNASATNSWLFSQAQGAAPAGTAKVRMLALLVDQSAATAYVDDVQANPGNVLTNAGFEVGLTNWTAFNGAAAGTAPTDPVRTGTGSLILPGFGGFGVPGVYQSLPASPGQVWNLEGYMFTSNALSADATFGLLKIVWSDGTSDLPPGTVYVGSANFSNPGIESRPLLNSTSPTNTWVFTQAQGVAPAGTTQVHLFALFVDQSAGTGYYDDLDAAYVNPVTTPPVVINYPTNNAPTPTVPSARVLSMYNSSGTYVDHSGINWYASWSGGGSDFTITNPPGSVVKKKIGLTFWGVEFYSPNQIDATPYNTFHVDVWTPNANQFGIQLVSLGPTEAAQVNIPPSTGEIVSNQWVSLDIPLSQFANANTNTVMSALQQLLFLDDATVGGGVTGGNFYVDNVYFYVSAVAPNIATLSLSGSVLTLPVPTQNGFNYVLQATPLLAPATWTNVQTNSGTGGTVNFSIPFSPGTPQQFFRIQLQ